MKQLFDLNDPFFKPLWIRLLIVAGTAAWSAFEFVSGAPAWGTLFGAVAAYAFYGLFIVFDPRDREVGDDDTAE